MSAITERQEIRAGKKVTVVERPVSQEVLEKADLLTRLEAVEKHLAKAGFTPPTPPKGFVRQTSQQ